MDPNRLPLIHRGVVTDCDAGAGHEVPETVRPRIAAVGRLAERKGFADLIAACGLLRDTGLDFECVIAGSGPELSRLNDLIDQHGLRDVIQLTGENLSTEEFHDLLASSRAFALPCVRDGEGDTDGLPQDLVEAMACGVAVVSTRLAGISDLVREGETGLLIAPANVNGLAGALRRLLTDGLLAKQLGRQGQAWTRARFDRNETIRRFADLFSWAIANPDGSAPAFALASAPVTPNVLDRSPVVQLAARAESRGSSARSTGSSVATVAAR